MAGTDPIAVSVAPPISGSALLESGLRLRRQKRRNAEKGNGTNKKD